MFYKAFVFGDKTLAKIIYAEPDPKAMKKKGEETDGFDQDLWFPVSIQVLISNGLFSYY
jgi:predicted NAD-dependent protein-ADP-ribosyltransferase YbiA (DUF1768 family)